MVLERVLISDPGEASTCLFRSPRRWNPLNQCNSTWKTVLKRSFLKDRGVCTFVQVSQEIEHLQREYYESVELYLEHGLEKAIHQ